MSGKNTLLKIIFVFSMIGVITLAAMLPGAAKAYAQSDEAGFFARLLDRPEFSKFSQLLTLDETPTETPEVTQETPEPTEETTPEPTEETTPEATEEPTGEPTEEPTEEGSFEMVGTIFTMEGQTWDVSGITVIISDTNVISGTNVISDTFKVGMLVKVEGELQEDGSVLATEIKPALNGADPENNGNPYPGNPHDSGVSELVGTLTAMDEDTSWMLNGVTEITLDDNTEVEEGLEIGQMVKVLGELQEDGSFLATDIKRFAYQSMNGKLGFGDSVLYGTLDAVSGDTWTVGSFTVTLDEDTEQDGTFEQGDNVKVRGTLQQDGSILASYVSLAGETDNGKSQSGDHTKASKVVFTGEVTAINDDGTWEVGGKTLLVDDDTEVNGDVEEGMTVKVVALAEEDGTYTAVEIRLFGSQSQSGGDTLDTSDQAPKSNKDGHGKSGGR